MGPHGKSRSFGPPAAAVQKSCVSIRLERESYWTNVSGVPSSGGRGPDATETPTQKRLRLKMTVRVPMSVMAMFRQLAEAALEPKTRDRLFRGRSPDCVRRDQVGTKTLPQKGCGLKNREGVGCNRLELPNTPSSRTDDPDHVDRPRSSAMPNVQFQIARMISSHVP